MATNSSTLTPEQARELVAFKREDAGPGLVEARRAAEDEARDLLDGAAGEMTADDLGRLLAGRRAVVSLPSPRSRSRGR